MNQLDQTISAVTSLIGSFGSIAIQIYMIVVFFRIARQVKELKSQQDRMEQNIFIITKQQEQIEHNISLIMQQQARIEQEIKK